MALQADRNRVLIHALGADMGGALRHLTNFLPELAAQDRRREYVVLVRDVFPAPDLPSNIRLERISRKRAASWVSRVKFDLWDVPALASSLKCGAVVSLTNFGPVWCDTPHVLFQRNALFFCDYYWSLIGGRKRWEALARRRLLQASISKAEVIVTPSEAMASMIRNTFPNLANKRFLTLYHGFEREALAAPLEDRFASLLKDRRGSKFLYPTHAARHKGFEVLLDMLAALKSKGVEFCLFATIDRQDWPEGVRRYEQRIRELALGGEVVFTGRVPQDQMGELYRACDLMIYPSLCESFGFSMIEAMGHGLPIVASDTMINREICREGAIYYAPLNPVAGAETVMHALDGEIRQQICQGGLRRMASFDWSWRRYASEFVAILDSLR